MRAGLIALLVLLVAAVVVALNSFFIVNPTQQALVLQFGEVRQAVRNPGINAKIPVVQDVLFLDKRVLDLNVPAQEIIAADQKRLVVDAFMRYRIANPVRFYQTVNNVREGSTRLSTFAQSSLRAVLADATFQDIVRDDRPELMRRIRDDVAARARDIGVEVVDVRIRRADLPEANSEAIFERMKTERVQEATQIRAQGREAAQRLRAAADRTATVLRAEADRESEQVRGEGDGQANAIFARAYSEDPQFFAFFRAMQAYETSLAAKDTRLVLSPQSDFFRYFNDPLGTGGYAAGTNAPQALMPAPQAPAAAPADQPAGSDEAAAVTVPPIDTSQSASQQALEHLRALERRVEPTPSSAMLPDAATDLGVDGVAPAGDAAAGDASATDVPAATQSAATEPAATEPAVTEPAATETTAPEAPGPDTPAVDEQPGAAEADTPAQEEAAVPADNVDIDAPAEPGQITIVRPDRQAE